MNKMVKFTFNDREMTVIKSGEDVWFRGHVVASILGYVNSRDAINQNKLSRTWNKTKTPGVQGTQDRGSLRHIIKQMVARLDIDRTAWQQ